MPNKIKITVPNPCHESWNDMTPEGPGRFCDSCRHTVIDFTRMSDTEVANTLKKHKTGCGWFLETQLDRELAIRKEKNALWAAAGAAAVAFLSLGTNEVQAQQSQKTEQTENKLVKGTDDKSAEPHLIEGTLLDSNGDTLEGIIITVKNSDLKAVSNAKGKFNITVKPGDVLHFTGNGLVASNVPITSAMDTHITFNMHYVPKIMRGGRYF